MYHQRTEWDEIRLAPSAGAVHIGRVRAHRLRQVVSVVVVVTYRVASIIERRPTLFLRPYLAHFCSFFRHSFAVFAVLTPGIRKVAPEDRGSAPQRSKTAATRVIFFRGVTYRNAVREARAGRAGSVLQLRVQKLEAVHANSAPPKQLNSSAISNVHQFQLMIMLN